MNKPSNWMLVEHFTVHQAAVLWSGLDPSTHHSTLLALPSEAMAIKQALFGAIVSGELKVNSDRNSFAMVGNYSDSIVSRAELEKFARSKDQFPKFLFDTLAPFVPPPDPFDSFRNAAISPVMSTQSKEPTAFRNRGGRPAEYDWDSFILEIIRIANTVDGLPDKQTELTNHMLEWFSKNYDSEPAESTVRSKISKIYRHLHQDDDIDKNSPN